MIALQNPPALQATLPWDLHQCNVAPFCFTLYSQQLRAMFYITCCTLHFLKLLCKYLLFCRNKTIAWWRHFTTTTRIVQFFVLLVQIEAFLNFIFNLNGTNLNKKARTKWILVVVVKCLHRLSGLFLAPKFVCRSKHFKYETKIFEQLSHYFI